MTVLAEPIEPLDKTESSSLVAESITAWFGKRMVLDRVSLELIPGAALAGEVLLDGQDIYEPTRRLTDARRAIGMVFQKPNLFPAMSIEDTVLAGLKLTGTMVPRAERAQLVEESLTRAGLWSEVRERLGHSAATLSGGQQQRLCIARSLAVRPRVLLMDEPCSALDPTPTRVVEHGPTDAMFSDPRDPRTADYVHGRFG